MFVHDPLIIHKNHLVTPNFFMPEFVVVDVSADILGPHRCRRLTDDEFDLQQRYFAAVDRGDIALIKRLSRAVLEQVRSLPSV